MAAESLISWLARRAPDGTWHQGHTLNPWSGCYVKSEGCRECYAKNLPPSMRRGAVWGPREMRVLAPDSYLAQVHAWNRAAEKLGIRMPVFCASTADIFEKHAVESERERLNSQRAKVWALVAATPWLDWLFLTKEPENILDMIPAEWVANGCPANVWMGCTVENQKAADARIPHLLRVPAVVRFLSVEPMVGAVDLREWVERIDHCSDCDAENPPQGPDKCPACGSTCGLISTWGYAQAGRYRTGERYDEESEEGRRDLDGTQPSIDWVLCGGESGRGVNVRPMAPEWARSLRDQCVAAGVAFHFKQHGEHDEHGVRLGKKATGRVLDGRTWDELPAVR